MKILGCEVPVSTLEAWSEIFVFLLEPVFLTRATQHLGLDALKQQIQTKPKPQRGWGKQKLEFSKNANRLLKR
jgi:hypothetical protein